MSAAIVIAGAAAVLAVLAIVLAVFGLADVPGRWRRARAIRRARRFFHVLGVDPLPWQLEYFGHVVRGRRG
ncbi:MAG: hypothetical protein IE935_13735 [Micrococcales bacterium]|nr:hypothetical protein [Micrococcales bacterium]